MANKLLNYTTKIEAEASQTEIRGMLRVAGATGISEQIDKTTRKTTGYSFRITTATGDAEFLLPARIDQVYAVLEKQGTLPYRGVYRATARERAAEATRVEGRNRAQAERVAWRILRDWLEAQLALIHVGMVQLEEIMLPYLLVEGDEPGVTTTVYELGKQSGLFKLPAPKE